MRIRTAIVLIIGLVLGGAAAFGAGSTEPFGAVPKENRLALKDRLALYVKEYRERDWGKLYDLISDKGRGGVNLKTFVTLMGVAHGRAFANYPDLLNFLPDRATAREEGGYDIYGCGKARREGDTYNGIVVVHAVFERNGWFFTGWTFTDVPNDPCQELTNPSWEPDNVMSWDKPMEELRLPPKDIK